MVATFVFSIVRFLLSVVFLFHFFSFFHLVQCSSGCTHLSDKSLFFKLLDIITQRSSRNFEKTSLDLVKGDSCMVTDDLKDFSTTRKEEVFVTWMRKVTDLILQ